MSTRTALVVGGTGPTGPHIVNGLVSRGYRVTIFHRGTHESDDIPPCVEHIHGDPHFSETITSSIRDRQFDLVVAAYGRIRLLAEFFRGRTDRFIAIGGVAAYQGHFSPERLVPSGMSIPAPEAEPVVHDREGGKFSWRVAETEQDVLRCHPLATIFRYPLVYGPNQIMPLEWCLIRRALDRRPFVILPSGGLQVVTRGYARNLAHAVLLAVDQPAAAAGQIYNCGDERQLSYRQMTEVVASALGHRWEIIDMPAPLATPAWPMIGPHEAYWHRLVDISKIRRELNYSDLVPAVEAIRETVFWYARRRDILEVELGKRLNDPFDYVAEDRLVAEWRRLQQSLPNVQDGAYVAPGHPYPHPVESGLTRDHRGR
ncbi:MAG: NAD-dependent epimerase/dehydratase family protein [Hyphomicrobiales bacterium]|nr:MAG: NAD-dependent epimerase/dehydratase family protein [Hyphomicrobiales bacterium]